MIVTNDTSTGANGLVQALLSAWKPSSSFSCSSSSAHSRSWRVRTPETAIRASARPGGPASEATDDPTAPPSPLGAGPARVGAVVSRAASRASRSAAWPFPSGVSPPSPARTAALRGLHLAQRAQQAGEALAEEAAARERQDSRQKPAEDAFR